MVLALPAAGDASQQSDGVGMPGIVEDLTCRALFDELSRVHDADAVAHLRDHRQVVADEQDRGLEPLTKRRHQVEHLGLDGGVKGRRRLVEYEQSGLRSERHGDHDPLQHPARELMGIGVQHPSRIRDLHHAEQFLGPGQGISPLCAGHLVHLGHLAPDSDRRVQRPPRLLVDHRDGPRPEFPQFVLVHGRRVLPVHRHRTGAEAPVAGEIARDGEGGRRLAAARLADEAERLLAADGERDVAQGQPVVAAHAICHVEVADLQRRRGRFDGGDQVGRGGKGHWTSTDSIASPMRLMAIMSDAMARAGKSVSHQ